MDFVDCCWHVVTTSQVAKSVLADVTFHWEWKCTKHYTDSINWYFAMLLKFFSLLFCAVQLHYDDGLSFIYLCRLHWMILLSLSSRTQSYLPSDLALANAGYFKAKVATKLYDLTYTELEKYANCLRWQTTPSSCVKLSSMEGATSPTWRSVSLTSLTTCKTSSTKTQRFESEPKVTIGKCRLMRFIRCVRTTLSSPTPHTPRWRGMGCSSSPKDDRWGLFYKIEIAIFSLACYFKSCQATSDLRENPLVTVLGSHAAMTCQIVVGNGMSCILIEVKNILIDINWCWRWWSILKAVSQVSATLTITLAGRWNGDLNTLHVCHVLFLKVLLVPNTL